MHNAFAHQLLKLRTEQQLSQTDIANLLFVSRQAVSKWENGDTEPNLDNLIALARILNVSLENLITGSSNPNSLLLTLSHVSKSFSKPVLKDVNLTVHSNERIALLGANGAGKTTLIQIIIGLINPDKGTVKFDLDPKKSLNIMPQENVLIPDITVLEQIKLVSLRPNIERNVIFKWETSQLRTLPSPTQDRRHSSTTVSSASTAVGSSASWDATGEEKPP